MSIAQRETTTIFDELDFARQGERLRQLPILLWQTLVGGWTADRAQRFNWLPVLIGVGIGIYFALPLEPPAYVAIVTLVPLAIYLVVRWLEAPDLLVAVAACIAATGLGFTSAIVRVQLLSTVTLEQETRVVEVSGQILSAEPADKNRTRVLLDSARIDPQPRGAAPTRVRVSLAKAPDGLRPGEWIKVRAVLRPLPAPVAPGGYDFARTLWFDGIGAVGFSMGTTERIGAIEGDGLLEQFSMWMAGVRQVTSDRIRSQLDARSGPIAVAFLTGERTLIAGDDQQAMRDSSLAHLLSISGLHMALAGFGFLAALRFIFALIPAIALNYPVKKWAAVAALFASFAYLLLSGSSIPAVRSFIMIAIAFIAIIADRPAISLRVVALSALFILIVTPESWIDPSFQMSFGAVVGLVSAFEWWRQRKRPEDSAPRGYFSRVVRVLGGTAATSFVAGFSSAPFAAYHFNRFANYGVAANLLVTPFVSFIIMPAGVIALLLMPFGLDGIPLRAMGWGIGVMLDIAHWVASWPGAAIMVDTMPTVALVLMTGGGLWLALWQAPWRLAGVALIVAGFVASFFGSAPDVIVAADGRNMAVRGGDGQLHLLSVRRDVFGAQMWLKRDADRREVKDVALGGDDGFVCDAAGCMAKIEGREDRRLLFARSPEALHDGCDQAAVIIDQTRGWRPPCGAPLLTVRPALLRDEGAIALALDGEKIRWTSVARERGLRPWTGVAPASLAAPGSPAP